MSLSEKVQQINREIGATVERALSDVRREVSQRLRESAEALQERISQIAPSLPGAFVAHDDLAPFATRAERRARRSAAAEIRDALSAVDGARSQAEILSALLRETGRWSSRSAVLLLRGGEVRGWGSLGFGDADGGAIREVSLGAPDGGAWGEVFQGQSGARLSPSDCAALCGRLEAPLPRGGVLLPLVLRDRVAAVLYADRTDGDALGVESLQILIYTAALAIESLAFRERAATATLQPIEGDEEEAAPTEAPAPAPAVTPDVDTAPEAMAASAAQREAEAAPETETTETDTETAESLTPEPLQAAAAGIAEPETEPETAIEPEPEPVEIEAASFQEESAWQAPAPLAPYAAYNDTATAELSAVPELETEMSLDTGLDTEVEIEAEPDYSSVASVGYTEPALEEPIATEAPWTSSAELEPPVETSYGAAIAASAAIDEMPAPAWAATEEPALEEATTPTQQIDLGSLPSSSEPQSQPPAGSAATVLLNRASLREAASPYAPYTEPERVEPVEPVREEPAPPPPTPIRPVPPPATTEVAPPAAAAESASLAGTPEVRPPSDVQGPGWAFANSRAAAAQPGDETAHEEARRLARLLVSEIKLYNEEQVEEGRRRRDVYERLKEDIDRSRQMYEDRVEPRILKSTDYFYQELVRILAAGDAKALGI